MNKVHDQIDRMKTVSIMGAKKKDVEQEAEKLKEYVNEFAKTGKNLKGFHHHEFDTYKDLKERIDRLQQKLDLYVSMQNDREKKFEKIEKKVRVKVYSNEEKIQLIKSKIQNLDREYKKIAGSGKYDKKFLRIMRLRLEAYKKKLSEFK